MQRGRFRNHIPPDRRPFISRQPFVAGTSEVYINGLRYTLGKDYKELTDGTKADGIEIPGIESDDEIILKAIPIN